MLMRWLKLAILLALPIFIIRAQPYQDRAVHDLILDTCPAPCFMGIRPGMTTLRQAVSVLQSHAWVDHDRQHLSDVVRNAVFYDAPIPRTVIEWYWSAAAPDWIDATQAANLLVENLEVQTMRIQTHLQLGEVFLALGYPDGAQFIISDSPSRQGYVYLGWYNRLGMLVSAQGDCPQRHYYDLPVRILFRPDSGVQARHLTEPGLCQ